MKIHQRTFRLFSGHLAGSVSGGYGLSTLVLFRVGLRPSRNTKKAPDT